MRSTCSRAKVVVERSELDVDDAPDPDATHVETELRSEPSNRLALRIEDPLLRPHEDGRFKRARLFGSARYSSNEMEVSRSKAST